MPEMTYLKAGERLIDGSTGEILASAGERLSAETLERIVTVCIFEDLEGESGYITELADVLTLWAEDEQDDHALALAA